jgi:hypothetical protein
MCRGQARARCLEQRAAKLLPVEYLHVVFTVPNWSRRWLPQNQRVVYGILSRAAAETLLQIAADPRHLAPGSVFWRCCIPGGKTFIIIHASTACS